MTTRPPSAQPLLKPPLCAADATRCRPSIKCLKDPSWEVRQAAAKAIGVIGESSAVEALVPGHSGPRPRRARKRHRSRSENSAILAPSSRWCSPCWILKIRSATAHPPPFTKSIADGMNRSRRIARCQKSRPPLSTTIIGSARPRQSCWNNSTSMSESLQRTTRHRQIGHEIRAFARICPVCRFALRPRPRPAPGRGRVAGTPARKKLPPPFYPPPRGTRIIAFGRPPCPR